MGCRWSRVFRADVNWISPPVSEPVAARILVGDLLERDDRVSPSFVDAHHLADAGLRRVDDIVSEHDREGLVADEVPGLEDRVPQPERGLLAHVGNPGEIGDRPHFFEEMGLAPLFEHPFQLEGGVEMVLDGVLAPAGHDDDAFQPRRAGLLDDVLDQRTVNQGQHFLGLRLGGRQEARSQSRGGKNGNADGRHRGES